MLKGSVTSELDAVVAIEMLAVDGTPHVVQGCVDAGFDGFITLPGSVLRSLDAIFNSYASVMLADGAIRALRKYEVRIRLSGAPRVVLALEADGEILLGMALMRGCRIAIDVHPGGEVTVEPIA